MPMPVTTTRRSCRRSVIAAHIPIPPSTPRTAPVTNDAASETRKRTARATSSGSPRRASGVDSSSSLAQLLGAGRQSARSRCSPGATQLTRMLRATELARERLRQPDQAGLRGRVVRLTGIAVHADDTRLIVTIEPWRRRIMRRLAAWHEEEGAAEVRVDHRVPVLGREARDQAVARDAGVADERCPGRRAPPRTVPMSSRAASAFETSACSATARRPRPDRGDDLVGRVGVRAVVDADGGAGGGKLDAIARPIPREPPVTSATRPSSSGTGKLRAHAFETLGFAIEMADRLRSIRLTRPVSTLPGPISTNVRTPRSRRRSTACVKRTGVVSCRRAARGSRAAFSRRW